MNKLILLSGQQGSGKSTIQRLLAPFYRPLNFADVIYRIHDFALETVAGHGIQLPSNKDGKLLQLLGTEWGRSLDKDIWIKILRNQVDHLLEDPEQRTGGVCIGDCRFENEFDAFPDALRVRLHAPPDVRQKRAQSWRENTSHPSECDLDCYDLAGKFDLYINTEGGITPEETAKFIMEHISVKALRGV